MTIHIKGCDKTQILPTALYYFELNCKEKSSDDQMVT